ncbi:CvpA family protein [Xanthovirga aplysinae]|uniref:CvpA family protein n=1 Tax=Xanthovirga aplysinae TaxID=2529853 RepID=UPI0012BD39D4|nr:CvpA family protein [Xanthovirga aplysinae]MTI31313.1 CvpA family protein [Xanthovirga aplysinae]
MKTLDIILMIPLLFGAYRGFSKGLLLEIIGLIAFVLAIIIGIRFLNVGIEFLISQFGQLNTYLPYIAFLLLFIGTLLLINLLGRGIKKVLDMTLLGKVDNLAGALVGVFKWAFLISLILWVSASVGILIPKNLQENTIIYPFIADFAPLTVKKLEGLLPYAKGMIEMVSDLLGRAKP